MKKGSVSYFIFELLGEVEIAFGLWAICLLITMGVTQGFDHVVSYLENSDFTEAFFVFAMMTVATTRPIVHFSTVFIRGFSRLISGPQSKVSRDAQKNTKEAVFYFSTLFIGPLLGSLITEPAAMGVTATILRNQFYNRNNPDESEKFRYITLGTLFTNISIGGALTHFAAPPMIMVVKTWNWNTPYVFSLIGWKAALACFLNALLATFLNFKHLIRLSHEAPKNNLGAGSSLGLTLFSFTTLLLIVLTSVHAAIFLGILFLFFIVRRMLPIDRSDLKIRPNFMVGVFLAGLVVLGGLQSWWLAPLLQKLDTFSLFLGTSALTAITDNAALTFLGSQIPQISEAHKYALVAGAIVAGGVTVIANAPNPAGFALLQDRFSPNGISSTKLFLGALLPTFIAMGCFWLL